MRHKGTTVLQEGAHKTVSHWQQGHKNSPALDGVKVKEALPLRWCQVYFPNLTQNQDSPSSAQGPWAKQTQINALGSHTWNPADIHSQKEEYWETNQKCRLKIRLNRNIVVQNLKILAFTHNGVFRHCDTLWYKVVFCFILLEIRLQKAFEPKSISTASSFVHQTIHLNFISISILSHVTFCYALNQWFKHTLVLFTNVWPLN